MANLAPEPLAQSVLALVSCLTHRPRVYPMFHQPLAAVQPCVHGYRVSQLLKAQTQSLKRYAPAQ